MVHSWGDEEGVFAGPFSGRPQRLDCGVPSVPPVLDSTGRVLLLCHDSRSDDLGQMVPERIWAAASRLSLARLDRLGRRPGASGRAGRGRSSSCSGTSRPTGCWPWWPSQGRTPRRSPRGAAPRGPAREPEVDEGPAGGQSVWSISLATGRAAELGPAGACVWEMSLAPDGSVACVCSSEPGEAGWYSAFIGRFDPATGTVRRLYTPHWQVASVTVDPRAAGWLLRRPGPATVAWSPA